MELLTSQPLKYTLPCVLKQVYSHSCDESMRCLILILVFLSKVAYLF